MSVPTLLSLLLLAVAGLLAPVGSAHAHAGHGHADARIVAPLPATVAVLESGSHCPSDTGGCCCRADRCSGFKPARALAGPPAAPAAVPPPLFVVGAQAANVSGVAAGGAPATTRLARAPPSRR